MNVGCSWQDQTSRAAQQTAKQGEGEIADEGEVGTPYPSRGKRSKPKAKAKAKAKNKARAKATAKAKAKTKAKAKAKTHKDKGSKAHKRPAAKAVPTDFQEADEQSLEATAAQEEPCEKRSPNKKTKRQGGDTKKGCAPDQGKSKTKKPKGKSKAKATFARRWRPTMDPAGAIWDALKMAFEAVVLPVVDRPSYLEEPLRVLQRYSVEGK